MDSLTALLVAATTLALPGPTNALLAISGSALGLRRSLPMITATLAGYGLAVAAVALLAGTLTAIAPQLADVLRLVAAGVLLHAALRLWQMPDLDQLTAAAPKAAVGWGHVFFATLLNPKSLVLYVTAFPEASFDGPALTVARVALPVLIVMSSAAWIALGARLTSWHPNLVTAGWIERGGALVLVAFAAIISTSAVSSMLS